MTEPVRLDDPEVVRREYATEDGLRARVSVYEGVHGPDARDTAFAAVAEVGPGRVLEVGCGMGEFAQRLAADLEAEIIAVDLSPRMVELTRERGVDARVADVQQLPFGDGEFDCVCANWVLYHVADVNQGVSELARVLRPGGRLVAATLFNENLLELWELLGGNTDRRLSFDSENGGPALERHFAHVERRDAFGTVIFPDTEAMRRFVAVTITHAHLADRVPVLTEPFRARSRHAVFVAERAA